MRHVCSLEMRPERQGLRPNMGSIGAMAPLKNWRKFTQAQHFRFTFPTISLQDFNVFTTQVQHVKLEMLNMGKGMLQQEEQNIDPSSRCFLPPRVDESWKGMLISIFCSSSSRRRPAAAPPASPVGHDRRLLRRRVVRPPPVLHPWPRPSEPLWSPALPNPLSPPPARRLHHWRPHRSASATTAKLAHRPGHLSRSGDGHPQPRTLRPQSLEGHRPAAPWLFSVLVAALRGHGGQQLVAM